MFELSTETSICKYCKHKFILRYDENSPNALDAYDLFLLAHGKACEMETVFNSILGIK